MRNLMLLAVVIVGGCAGVNSGIVPDGPDAYRIMRQGSTGASTSGGLQSKNYAEASAFCAQQGKVVETLGTDSKQSRPLGGFPEANLRFRCVDRTPNQ